MAALLVAGPNALWVTRSGAVVRNVGAVEISLRIILDFLSRAPLADGARTGSHLREGPQARRNEGQKLKRVAENRIHLSLTITQL
jgi:hypothetical protein